jgi:hypothetical protein
MTIQIGTPTELSATEELSAIEAEASLPKETPGSESMLLYNNPEPDPTEESWQALKRQVSTFFAKLPDSLSHFFQQNRRLLLTLGWIVLGFLGIRLLFSALDTIDDIPLIAPTLELIGLLYVGWFVYRYLIRASDRQELVQMIDRLKTEVIGSKG